MAHSVPFLSIHSTWMSGYFWLNSFVQAAIFSPYTGRFQVSKVIFFCVWASVDVVASSPANKVAAITLNRFFGFIEQFSSWVGCRSECVARKVESDRLTLAP